MTISSTRLAYLLAPVLALVGFGASADSHEPAPQPALESFLCTYVSGTDRGDLDSATDYYLKQAEKAGIDTPPAYLWTKVKGTGVDLIWHNVYESLGAMAAQLDATGAASEMADVLARYDTVASCMPMAGRVTPVHQRSETDDGAATFVAAYACRTRGMANPADMADLNRHIGGVFGAMGDAAPVATYAITPITTDASGPNAVYFNVFESASHWAAVDGALNGTADGQMLVRHFTSMLECSTNLWASEQVIGEN